MLVVCNFGNLPRIQALEPFLVKIRLGRNQDIRVIWKLEGAARPLFGLIVEVLQPLKWIRCVNFDGGGARLFSLSGRLGIKEIAIGFSDVFGEETAGDVFVNRGAGGEEIHAGSSEISGPGNGLGPWSGGEV